MTFDTGTRLRALSKQARVFALLSDNLPHTVEELRQVGGSSGDRRARDLRRFHCDVQCFKQDGRYFYRMAPMSAERIASARAALGIGKGELARVSEAMQGEQLDVGYLDDPATPRITGMSDTAPHDPLIDRVRSALGTEENGDALVDVARAAHRAEQELAAVDRAEMHREHRPLDVIAEVPDAAP